MLPTRRMRLKQTGTISGCVQRDQSLICRFTARIFQIVNRSLFQKLKHIWLILLKTEWPAPAMTGDVASAASKHTGLQCWSCDGRTVLTHMVSACFWSRARSHSLQPLLKQQRDPWILLCSAMDTSTATEASPLATGEHWANGKGLWLEISFLGYSKFSKLNFRWIWRGWTRS